MMNIEKRLANWLAFFFGCASKSMMVKNPLFCLPVGGDLKLLQR